MTVYFQHVGERGGQEDFPKTIGTHKSSLKQFHFAEIAPYLQDLSNGEKVSLENSLNAFAPDGFQIWGIPSGAKSVIRAIQPDDFLLLLESVGPGGSFYYGGRIIARPSAECFELSMHLWGRAGFPLILFLKGGLTSYKWPTFCEHIGYKANWNPAGNTYRIPFDRIRDSVFSDEETLVERMMGRQYSLSEPVNVADTLMVDPAELHLESEEGRAILREHMVRERSANLVRQFKAQLANFSCCVCGFNFETAYGPIGRRFIEAHHIVPVSSMRAGDITRIQDLVAVCSNCHRMLHCMSPSMSTEELKAMAIRAIEQRH